MMSVLKDIRIPEERRGVLIGRGGRTKIDIEMKTKTKINIGDYIEITGEPLNVFIAEIIIKAVGRGFSPKMALELLDEEKMFYIIDLPERGLERTRARIIGSYGKARKRIERETNTRLSVYGKTVSLIGKPDNVEIAKKALEKIITGSPHKNAYKTIRKIRK